MFMDFYRSIAFNITFCVLLRLNWKSQTICNVFLEKSCRFLKAYVHLISLTGFYTILSPSRILAFVKLSIEWKLFTSICGRMCEKVLFVGNNWIPWSFLSFCTSTMQWLRWGMIYSNHSSGPHSIHIPN